MLKDSREVKDLSDDMLQLGESPHPEVAIDLITLTPCDAPSMTTPDSLHISIWCRYGYLTIKFIHDHTFSMSS